MSPLLLSLLTVIACSRCEGDSPCAVESGRYYAVPPAGWDGESPLPVALHFHGWTGHPAQYYANPAVTEPFSDAGILLVLPEGVDATWTVDNMGLQGSHRDEIAFVEEVLSDVRERWPVDDDRVFVSGFSLGASLAHVVACELGGDQFTAASPMSGGFWEPVPTTCAGPPVPVCHIHGLNDSTWPIEGREVTEGDAVGWQVPVEEDIAMWRSHNGCTEASREEIMGPLTCTIWEDCASGSVVELCVHDGGHERFDGWVEREVAWFDRFAP